MRPHDESELNSYGHWRRSTFLWVGWGVYIIYGIERPHYEVLERLSRQVEIRQYDQQIWISATDMA